MKFDSHKNTKKKAVVVCIDEIKEESTLKLKYLRENIQY